MSDDEPIYLDIGDLAGVDANTYAAADSGDRQAQKLMLRNLLTSQASAAALTTGHWTAWMLRMIATGERAGDCRHARLDRGGGARAASSRRSRRRRSTNWSSSTSVRARSARRRSTGRGRRSPREERESAVVDLYLVSDRLASGEPGRPRRGWPTPWRRHEALECAGRGGVLHRGHRPAELSGRPGRGVPAGGRCTREVRRTARAGRVYAGKVGMTALLGRSSPTSPASRRR